jgi:hypothetical protein
VRLVVGILTLFLVCMLIGLTFSASIFNDRELIPTLRTLSLACAFSGSAHVLLTILSMMGSSKV